MGAPTVRVSFAEQPEQFLERDDETEGENGLVMATSVPVGGGSPLAARGSNDSIDDPFLVCDDETEDESENGHTMATSEIVDGWSTIAERGRSDSSEDSSSECRGVSEGKGEDGLAMAARGRIDDSSLQRGRSIATESCTAQSFELVAKLLCSGLALANTRGESDVEALTANLAAPQTTTDDLRNTKPI